MKAEIHPKNYRPVIFKDSSTSEQFLINSTIHTEQTGTWEDGKEYPLYMVEISSSSHPFYTGKQKLVDTQGRVERFEKRVQKTKQRAAEQKAQKDKQKSKKTPAGARDTRAQLEKIKQDLAK